MNRNQINYKTVNYSTVQLGDGVAQHSFPISASNANSNQTAAIENFSHYKLHSISYQFTPLQNTFGVTANGATTTIKAANAPTPVSLFVNNRDETYTDIQTITNNPRHKSHAPMRYIKRYAKLRPQMDVSMGTTAITVTGRNMFISTGDLDAEFGTFIFTQLTENIAADSTVPILYSMKETMYFTLKNMNIN